MVPHNLIHKHKHALIKKVSKFYIYNKVKKTHKKYQKMRIKPKK